MRLLVELWPALIPWLLYAALLLALRDPGWRRTLTRGTLFWTICASVLLAIASLLWLAGHQTMPQHGRYLRPVYRPGEPTVPGDIVPVETR